MPVGFFDDPSFRWSTDVPTNLYSAQAANGNIIHVLVNWSTVAPTKPANPLNGNDPAYNLSDIDALVKLAPKYGFQILMTIAQTPKWANGGKTPNYPPSNLNTLTQFCQMLATRYNGSKQGTGVVTRFSIWNEPNLQLFLAPQYNGTKKVSPATYAKLYMAGYKGIHAGNPTALVAAGETSNRGHNGPTSTNISIAPATFARLVSVANPKLPFAAWATHPYPSNYALGPAQRVSYPNVGFSTMNRFGADLAKWFHRPVPIWVTEYGEMTAPAAAGYGPISNALQAAHAKAALKLAQASPYVQMFVWFIFRDSAPPPLSWTSGLLNKSGTKKPAYNAFKSTALNVEGQTQSVPVGKKFTVKVAVPILAYYNAPGAKIGVTYKLLVGKVLYAIGQPVLKMSKDGTITLTVNFKLAKGKPYVLNVVAGDRGGRYDTTNVALLTS